MNKILACFTLIVVCSVLVCAQKQSEEYNKGEFFAGYSGASRYTGDDFEPIENGFNISAVYNFHKYIGIKADVSGTYRRLEGDYSSVIFSSGTSGRFQANHSLYNATAGIQFKDNRAESKLKPFGHILIGYGKHFDKLKTACPSGADCSFLDGEFEGTSLIIGGGIDAKLSRHIDIRIIQFDLNPIFYKSEGQTFIWANNRFSSGIVFKF